MKTDGLTAEVLVVGAGMSGLLAAAALQAQGLQVLVLEQNAQPGGRLATLPIAGGLADVGVQFFTVHSPEFRQWVESWLGAGMLFPWPATAPSTTPPPPEASILAAAGTEAPAAGGQPPAAFPRYAARGGMGSFAGYLAHTLPLHTGVRLESVGPSLHGWTARSEDGRVFTGHGLVLTAPVPLSLELLDQGHAVLSPGERQDLENIHYSSCLTAAFALDRSLELPEVGASQQPDQPVAWIADNRRKGLCDAHIVTVQAGPEYSRELWYKPDEDALAALQMSLLPYMPAGTQVQAGELRRWRFATPEALYPRRCLAAAYLPPLVFAGDAFGGPRVEGAALSGLAAARAITESVAQKQW